MNTPAIEEKQLATVKGQATKALSAANTLIIENDTDLENATDLTKKMKIVGKMIKDQKEAITKPINEALKATRALFAPIEKTYEDAEDIVKRKIVIYHNEQEKKRREEMAKIEARVEKGTMKMETAVKKMEGVQEVTASVNTGDSKLHFRTDKKVRVIDESIIPREYLIPDMILIKERLKVGVHIAGVELYEEKIPVIG